MSLKARLALLPALALCCALTYDSQGQVTWSFVAGDYATNYNSLGRPLDRVPSPVAITDGLLERIATAIPERRDIRSTNPEAIADDDKANLALSEAGEVFVTFLHDGAGYRNALGYFAYPDGQPPQSLEALQELMVFPNASFGGYGGDMRVGDTVSLGSFPAGTRIGFILFANGFDPNTGALKPNPWNRHIHTSLRDLNTELDAALRPHNVVLYDAPSELAVLAFEDLPRDAAGCDHDFNDVIFLATSNPPQAIDATRLAPLPDPIDTDGDGVLDGNDRFPADPDRAFLRAYPSEGERATLMFEDLWPQQGDYDLNDLVVTLSITEVLDADLRTKDLHIEGELIARGALHASDLHIAIEGAQLADIDSASLSVGGLAESLAAEDDGGRLTLRLLRDSLALTPAPAGFKFFNTEAGAPAQAPIPLSLSLTFASSRSLAAAPFDPFIARTHERGREVHLPGGTPTSRADPALFGTASDASELASGRTWRTASNLPFALLVAAELDHPLERRSILEAYPRFAAWAESGGADAADWSSSPSQGATWSFLQGP